MLLWKIIRWSNLFSPRVELSLIMTYYNRNLRSDATFVAQTNRCCNQTVDYLFKSSNTKVKRIIQQLQKVTLLLLQLMKLVTGIKHLQAFP